MRILQEQVKKTFCYQKLFWPFTVRTNCSSILKIFTNSRSSASSFKKLSWSLEQFFLTVGQNNFGNKISMFIKKLFYPILINQATHNKHSVQVFIFRSKRISSINFAERGFCDSKIQISHFFLLLLLFFQLMSKKILRPWNVVILILTLQCSYFQAPAHFHKFEI